ALSDVEEQQFLLKRKIARLGLELASRDASPKTEPVSARPQAPPQPVSTPVAVAPPSQPSPTLPHVSPPLSLPRLGSPPTPAKPTFDWEGLVGVQLFSWIAGIALVLAGIFFLKYSIDHGWLGPPMRMAIGLLTGLALVIVCEWKVARRYATTANAMDGAGIAI